MRGRSLISRMVSLITVGVASSVLLVGCPNPETLAGGGGSGCRKEFGGVMAVTLPETSKLNCAAINKLNSAMPSKPEAYLIRGDSPRLFWKCRFYGAEAQRVLLRCEHDKRHFSIIKSPS